MVFEFYSQRSAKTSALNKLSEKKKNIDNFFEDFKTKKKKNKSKKLDQSSPESRSFDSSDSEDEKKKKKKKKKEGPVLKKTKIERMKPPKRDDSTKWRHSTATLKQNPEDVSVCQCSEELDVIACGEKCMNRMLTIECTKGFCPMGDRCTNQRFQRKEYVQLERIGKDERGYGLRLLEDVPAGHFIIEYAGEIIDQKEAELRNAEPPDQHHYIMTLGNNEFVDARYKGNAARYINHSCNPNCETQKWWVQGALRSGIFSLKAIEAGTELTFDYQFETLGSSKGQKCLCGESNCRGHLGAKISEEQIRERRLQQEQKLSQMKETEKLLRKHLDAAQIMDHKIHLDSILSEAPLCNRFCVRPHFQEKKRGKLPIALNRNIQSSRLQYIKFLCLYRYIQK